MMRHAFVVLLAVALLPAGLRAQAPTVARAQQAYQELRYTDAIRLARQAVRERLGTGDQADAYEVLAFALAALDSTPAAIEAFKQLIFLDPDREPDVNEVAPRIVNAYTAALGDVLVVRRPEVEAARFVAGQGTVAIRFEVSRPSRAVVRVLGPGGYDAVVDSFLVARRGVAEWRAQGTAGGPAPEGAYRALITAVERDNQHGAQIAFVLTHAAVDTLTHLTALPGQSPLPEMERPPRDWRPLGVALLSTGLAAGATLALDRADLAGGPQNIVLGVSIGALLSGFVASLRRPEPEPVPANIRYNRLLAEELSRRNQDLAQQNAERRRQIQLTVTPVPAEGGR